MSHLISLACFRYEKLLGLTYCNYAVVPLSFWQSFLSQLTASFTWMDTAQAHLH